MNVCEELTGMRYNGYKIKIAKLIDNMAGVVLIFEDDNVAAHVIPLSKAHQMATSEE